MRPQQPASQWQGSGWQDGTLGEQTGPLGSGALIPHPVVSARRVPGDPLWLRKYLEYVAKFQLQQALVFNLDGEHSPRDMCPLPHPTQHPGHCAGAVPAGWHKAPETW